MDSQQRKELADFLKKKRAHLQPQDFGFSEMRRRTPGLRRQEVASLSGISLDWYTWLEQARDIQASRETLHCLAKALRLEPTEMRYLLELCGYQEKLSIQSRPEFIESSLHRVIDELSNCPCFIIGRRWDFLAWNRATEVIYGPLENLPDFERNGLWQYFIGKIFPNILRDRPNRAARAVSIFRALRKIVFLSVSSLM